MEGQTPYEDFNPTEVGKVVDASPKWRKNQEYEDEANRNGGGSIDEIQKTIPDVYRFCPYDYELILYYLKNKLLNLPLPINQIYEVDLYSHCPDFFAGNYKEWGKEQWYFFTPRYRKYPKGARPSRDAGNGYWKATGSDRTVEFENKPVGLRKSLVYYEGKSSRGNKTNWIMREYRIESENYKKQANNDDSMRLDEWVLCKIYRKAKKVDKSPKPRRKRSATVEIGTMRKTRKPRNKTVPFELKPIAQVISTTDQQSWNPVQTDLGNFPPMNGFVYDHQHFDSHSNSIPHQNLFMPIHHPHQNLFMPIYHPHQNLFMPIYHPLPNDWAALYGDDVYAPDFWDNMDSFERHCKDL